MCARRPLVGIPGAPPEERGRHSVAPSVAVPGEAPTQPASEVSFGHQSGRHRRSRLLPDRRHAANRCCAFPCFTMITWDGHRGRGRAPQRRGAGKKNSLAAVRVVICGAGAAGIRVREVTDPTRGFPRAASSWTPAESSMRTR